MILAKINDQLLLRNNALSILHTRFYHLSMKQPYTAQTRHFKGVDKNPHGISSNKKAFPMGVIED
jgi:hypothetical protein